MVIPWCVTLPQSEGRLVSYSTHFLPGDISLFWFSCSPDVHFPDDYNSSSILLQWDVEDKNAWAFTDQDSLTPKLICLINYPPTKIKVIGQTVWLWECSHTDRQTHTHAAPILWPRLLTQEVITCLVMEDKIACIDKMKLFEAGEKLKPSSTFLWAMTFLSPATCCLKWLHHRSHHTHNSDQEI